MDNDIIEKILGFDIHVQTSYGENKIISFSNFVNIEKEKSFFFIEKRDNEYPSYRLDLNIECNGYGVKYYNDDMTEKENKIHMNNEDIIRRRVAREILSMIETVCFGEEFEEYRFKEGSNGTRDLIMDNIKNTYKIG